jgi:hypothetical protein
MAVRLPDFTEVAGVQTGQVNVPPGDIRPSYPGGAPEAEALARTGAALGTLGTGLQTFGTAAATLAGHERHETNLVYAAQATADLRVKLARNEAAIKAENDPEKINQRYSEAQGYLDTAGQLIPDEGARAAWRARHMKDVVDAQLGAEARQRAVYNDRNVASLNSQSADLVRVASQTEDEVKRQQIASEIAALWDFGARAGSITETQREAHARKQGQNMILGRAQYLDALGRPQEASDYVMAHAKELEPDDLDRIARPLRDRAETQSSRAYVRSRQSGGGPIGAGGGAVAPRDTGRAGSSAELHNWGNIRRPGSTVGPKAGGFQSFESDEEGLAAISHQLDRYASGATTGKPLTTIEQIVSTWAPPHENPTEELIKRAEGVVGVDRKAQLDLSNPEVKAKMIEATIRNEWGGKYPVPGGPDLIRRVVAARPGEAPSEAGVAAAPAPIPAMANRVPLPQLLQEIEASPNSPEWKAKAVAEAHREQSEFNSINHAARVRLDQNMKDDITSRGATGVGHPEVTSARIEYLEGPEAALRHAEQQQQATKFYGLTSDFPQRTPAEMDARLAEIAPKPGQDDFLQQQHLHTAAVAKRNQVIKLRDDDAALAVSGAPPVKAALAAIAAAPPNDPAARQAYAAATLAEQQRVGILPEKQAVLTKGGAATLASQIANADPGVIDIGKQVIAPALAAYGEHWPKVMSDLVAADLPAEAQVLAMLTPAPGQPDTQAVARADYQKMMTVLAQKGGQKALADAAGTQKTKDINTAIDTDTNLQSFHLTTTGPRQFLIAKHGIENLALYYAGREDAQTAYKHAYDNIIGKKYDFEGRLRVPKGQLGVVERAGDARLAGLQPEDLRADMPGLLGLPAEYNREVMVDAIRRGYWVTNEADDGAVLHLQTRDGGTQLARLKDNQRVEFKFVNALAEYAAPQPGVAIYGTAPRRESRVPIYGETPPFVPGGAYAPPPAPRP